MIRSRDALSLIAIAIVSGAAACPRSADLPPELERFAARLDIDREEQSRDSRTETTHAELAGGELRWTRSVHGHLGPNEEENEDGTIALDVAALRRLRGLAQRGALSTPRREVHRERTVGVAVKVTLVVKDGDRVGRTELEGIVHDATAEDYPRHIASPPLPNSDAYRSAWPFVEALLEAIDRDRRAH